MRRSWGAVLTAFALALAGGASAQDKGATPDTPATPDKPGPEPVADKPGVEKPAADKPAGPKSANEAPLGAAGPETVEAPPRPQREQKDFVPVPDRWRLQFPEWERSKSHTGEQPYDKGSLADPYRQNILKGDYPIIGEDIFFVLTATSDTITEGRSFPIASGNSTDAARRNEFFGDFHQFFLNQNFIVAMELFKGDTAFKPKEISLKVTPVFNINYLKLFERNVVNIDVRDGNSRLDGHVAIQEAALEYHIADLSPNYDFLTVVAGIQPFQSDFRGFLYQDNNLGVRLQGNYFSNRLQLNLAYFHQLDKDTNSGLNDYEFRNQNVVITNLFVQDFLSELSSSFFGYTLLFSHHFNLDQGKTEYDDNGFLVRPGKIGAVSDAQGHIHNNDLRVHYLGLGGDGHIGPINITHQYYMAIGRDSYNTIAGRAQDVFAQFFAAEASVDIDWIRPKVSFLWASGDRNPDNGTAGGFSAIIDNPFFAGAGFSYFNRQSIPFPQTGVNLTNRLSLLPDFRSSKTQGKSNFVNPGLFLYNAGVSMKITPKLFLDLNVNFLYFDKTEVVEKVLVQKKIGKFIGIDYSAGVQYRPLLTENIIITVGAGALTPGQAFNNIYDNRTLYSAFAAVTFTY